MGWHKNITAEKFPEQGSFLNRPCRVRFHYGPKEFHGTVVRDDMEEPFVTIIKLDNGRYILSTECQYQPN
jgi:hypothetical protein